MTIGTVFTLFVVPVFYSLISKETAPDAMPAQASQAAFA